MFIYPLAFSDTKVGQLHPKGGGKNQTIHVLASLSSSREPEEENSIPAASQGATGSSSRCIQGCWVSPHPLLVP